MVRCPQRHLLARTLRKAQQVIASLEYTLQGIYVATPERIVKSPGTQSLY